MMTAHSENFGAQFECFVINLQRQPERLRDFMDRNAATKLDFQVFRAVDGEDTTNTELRAPDFIVPHVNCYTPGQLGLAMSHRKLWERCTTSGKPIIVFEDDAWIRVDFRSVVPAIVSGGLHSWDIIVCGYNLDSALDFELIPGCDARCSFSVQFPTVSHLLSFAGMRGQPALRRLRNAFGTCGYIISPQGARKLTSACFPMNDAPIPIPALNARMVAFSLDSMMNGVFRKISAWVCVPPLVLTPNDQNSSSTTLWSGDPAQREIGRNEPCPCGSGKKYKHCHGRLVT